MHVVQARWVAGMSFAPRRARVDTVVQREERGIRNELEGTIERALTLSDRGGESITTSLISLAAIWLDGGRGYPPQQVPERHCPPTISVAAGGSNLCQSCRFLPNNGLQHPALNGAEIW